MGIRSKTALRWLAAGLLLVLTASARPAAAAPSARTSYTRALARERTLRDATSKPTLRQLRSTIASYRAVVRRYPASGYSDNALWQAANLAALAFERFGQASDKTNAMGFLKQLRDEYPSSSLIDGANDLLRQLEASKTIAAAPRSSGAVAASPRETAEERSDTASPPPAPQALVVEPVLIRSVTRTVLPDVVRVSIEMDRELMFRQERLSSPSRVFFDLKGARPIAALQDATLRFSDDAVREIRLGRHPHTTTRIVMDMTGVDSYSVFTLYNPFRLVVDFRRAAGAVSAAETAAVPPPLPVATAGAVKGLKTEPKPAPPPAEKPSALRPAEPAAPLSPSAPAANSNGQFSLSRQLGLGISRIVIDAGHGGHDPGARGNGIDEAELVLDVALRLRRLLQKQPGIDVTMTRQTDVFIPLEQRTAIANRESADLFLSIHANASRNTKARGVETYFLNFASNPEAEAVAARENSTSGRTMHSLPEIVRAIALNNKIDESRDFAEMIQRSMVRRLSSGNKQLRDLGVKQAPFVVLIGAGMPSVLAEISFVTNKQEGQLLKTSAYRQQIAEALLDAVLRYQKSLKKINAIATR